MDDAMGWPQGVKDSLSSQKASCFRRKRTSTLRDVRAEQETEEKKYVPDQISDQVKQRIR